MVLSKSLFLAEYFSLKMGDLIEFYENTNKQLIKMGIKKWKLYCLWDIYTFVEI